MVITIIIALVLGIVVLSLILGYLLLYKPYIINIQNNAYGIGAQDGAKYVVGVISQQLGDCKTMLVPYGNSSAINITAIDCIGRWN